jgi:hypothetical protein
VDGLVKGAGAQADPIYQEEVQNICCEVDNLSGSSGTSIPNLPNIKGKDAAKYINAITVLIKSLNTGKPLLGGGYLSGGGPSEETQKVINEMIKMFLISKAEEAAAGSTDPYIIKAMKRLREVVSENITTNDGEGPEDEPEGKNDQGAEEEEEIDVPHPFGRNETSTNLSQIEGSHNLTVSSSSGESKPSELKTPPSYVNRTGTAPLRPKTSQPPVGGPLPLVPLSTGNPVTNPQSVSSATSASSATPPLTKASSATSPLTKASSKRPPQRIRDSFPVDPLQTREEFYRNAAATEERKKEALLPPQLRGLSTFRPRMPSGVWPRQSPKVLRQAGKGKTRKVRS